MKKSSDCSFDTKKNKFFRETGCRKLGNIKVFEVKTINQFSSVFDDTVKKFCVSPGICGYIVNVLGPYLASRFKSLMTKKEIDEILVDINDPDSQTKLVEDNIMFVRESRMKYIKSNLNTFSDETSKKEYLKDMVANYEISDFLIQKRAENVYFFRQSAWFWPELAEAVKHEEKDRIEEEKPFAKDKFIIETFLPERKLYTLEDCKQNRSIVFKKDQPSVFVTDLLGHFVCIVTCNLYNELKKSSTPILLLIDSTKGSYLGNTDVIKEIASLAFI